MATDILLDLKLCCWHEDEPANRLWKRLIVTKLTPQELRMTTNAKRFLIFAMVLLVTLPAFAAPAADPLSGTWKLVSAASSWSNGQAPKNVNLTITVRITADPVTAGELFEYRFANMTNAAHPVAATLTAPMDGKPHAIADNQRFNQISIRRIGPGQLEVLEMKDGDVILGAWWSLSPDGKQMIRRGVARTPDNHAHGYEEIFDRE